ncbi:MAG TPA: tol-pal system protein YbgF [Fluviicoccus sp.]|nr:tol-pal system protein YbgF [Fluviicoccus sp.]
MRKFGFLAFPLLASLSHAEVPVDEKPLSGAVQTRPVAPAQPLQSQSMDSAPSMQWDLYQQVQQLQQEIRQLRGQLEVQSNQIERLKQDARSRYLDLDQRITQLGVRVATPPATATDTSATQAAVVTPPPETVKPVPTVEDEKRAYFAAYEVFRSGGPNKAINPMRDFIKTFPQSTYIPGAYYWLGEFYLAASPADVNNARKSFRILVEQFPDAPKVPSALLKLASLADVDGKTADAARYLGDILKRFPASAEAASAKQWLKDHNLPIPKPEGKAKAADDTKPAGKPATQAATAKPEGKAKDSTPAAKPADKSEKPKAAH